MLSIKPFSSADAAGKYYSHGDYYGSEGEGTWHGDGAEELGLKGNFIAKNNHQFNNLLHGVLPSGQILGRKTKEGNQHTPGVDLTFSVPKSFSVEMLLNSNADMRLAMEKAVHDAVRKTLNYIEKEGYIVARKGDGGYKRESIHKLIFTTFMHTTNRNLEPQVHVHSFLANAAQCKDGKFRSITIDNLLENGKLFGQLFRNELALETKKLGFETNTTILSDGSSSFELSKIHPKMIEAFSTRRKEIVELCKLYDITTKEGRDKIVINSRKAKRLVTEAELRKAWEEIETKTLKEIDSLKSKSSDVESIEEPIHSEKTSERLTIKEVTAIAIKDISYNQTVFTDSELLKTALKIGIGDFTALDIKRQIGRLEEKGDLIRYKDSLTSRAALEKEKQILQFASNAIKTAKSMIKAANVDYHCKRFENREFARSSDFKMNVQQREAIKHILTSEDKIITMEGLPGVGKSTVLNAVRSITGQKIINLISNPFGFGEKFAGSAPTASAAKTLEQSAQVESNTLHSFLVKYQGYIEGRGKASLKHFKREYKNTVIFVDEASLISTNIMHQLLTLQEKFGFRLVLTGDTKQLESVEAGKPFEQILSVLKPVKLGKIVRQKYTLHRDAVVKASVGKVTDTFCIHADNINQANAAKLAENAVALYLGKTLKERDKTLLISPTRALRDKINSEIRIALHQDNTLKGEILSFSALSQKNMSVSDYSFAYAYNTGDIVKFAKQYKNGIEKGDYLKVISANSASNSLILEKSGKYIAFNLRKNTDYSSKLEIFKENNLELQQGLKVIFTKNNKNYGLVNSETATIDGFNKALVSLKLEDGQLKSIPIAELKHIDYGYCVTVHNAQGKTYENTIAAIGNNKLLNNQKMWLVALSRHKSEFTAFVEDKDKLQSYLIKNTGLSQSAVELSEKSLKSKSNEYKTSGHKTNEQKTLLSTKNHARIKNVRQIEAGA